MSKAKGRVRQ